MMPKNKKPSKEEESGSEPKSDSPSKSSLESKSEKNVKVIQDSPGEIYFYG